MHKGSIWPCVVAPRAGEARCDNTQRVGEVQYDGAQGANGGMCYTCPFLRRAGESKRIKKGLTPNLRWARPQLRENVAQWSLAAWPLWSEWWIQHELSNNPNNCWAIRIAPHVPGHTGWCCVSHSHRGIREPNGQPGRQSITSTSINS